MAQLVEVPGIGQVEFPDDMTDDQIAAVIKKNTMIGSAPEQPKSFMGLPPTSPAGQAAIDYMRANSFGSGIPKLAHDVGGKVTDLAAQVFPPEIAAGIGFGANVLTQAGPSFLTSGSVMGKAPQSLLNWPKWNLPKWLMQTAVKPSTDDLLSGSAGKAISTMLDEGITPTMGGMEKAARASSQLDNQVSQLISGSSAQVPVARIGDMRELNARVMKQMNPQADLSAVKAAWDNFRKAPLIAGKTEIPVQLAHELKKGTYQALGGKSYGEVGSASVEAQKTLARNAREAVGEVVPEIKEPLAKQAELMNVRDVAGARALLEANKNPLGLAGLRVDHPLSAATFLADRWAWLKAMTALGLHRGAYPQSIVPLGIAGSMATNQPALYTP